MVRIPETEAVLRRSRIRIFFPRSGYFLEAAPSPKGIRTPAQVAVLGYPGIAAVSYPTLKGLRLTSKLGTAFVGFYYFVSPPLGFLISKNRIMRTLTRRFLLEPILHRLKTREGDLL